MCIDVSGDCGGIHLYYPELTSKLDMWIGVGVWPMGAHREIKN